MMFNTADIFVDSVGGDDNGDGSQAAPFQTIQGAIAGGSVVAGNTKRFQLTGDFVLDNPIDVSGLTINSANQLCFISDSRATIDSGGSSLFSSTALKYTHVVGIDFNNLPNSGVWWTGDDYCSFINNRVDGQGRACELLRLDLYTKAIGNQFLNFASPSSGYSFRLDSRSIFGSNIVAPGQASRASMFFNADCPWTINNVFDFSEVTGLHRVATNPVNGWTATRNIVIGNRQANANSYFVADVLDRFGIQISGNYFENLTTPVSWLGNLFPAYFGNALHNCDSEFVVADDTASVLIEQNEILARSLLGRDYRLRRPIKVWPPFTAGQYTRHNPLRLAQ